MRRVAQVLALVAMVWIAGWLIVARVYDRPLASEASQWSLSPGQNLVIWAGESQLSRVLPKRHPVYRYSVVPGGIGSVQELREAVARDREVAAHYAGFQYDKAKLVRLERAQLVYLSYRMNGQFYWTRTPHLVRAGETVITDGRTTARTRCANQISLQKQLAVSPEEPPEIALEQTLPPVLPPTRFDLPSKYESAVLTGPGREPWDGPTIDPPWLLFPPPLPPIPINVRRPHGGGCETASEEQHEHQLGLVDDESKEVPCPPRGPHGVTPEPGTIVMFASGLGGLVLLHMYRQRKMTPAR